MFKGIVFALSACFIWGLIFIIPQFMESFSPIEIVLGRYLFYGGISLLLLLKGRLSGFFCYPISVWIKALYLSFLSGYYLWVILAIRYTSPEICALILGISPITIAFYGNWKQKEGNFKLLILPSCLIMIGLIMINAPHIVMKNSSWEYLTGLICSFIALTSWSVYVVLNSRFLKKNSHILSNEWATIQGVATLIWVIVCGLAYNTFLGDEIDLQKYEATRFVIGCAILGVACSWVGAALWNKASIYLPVSLAGQLMIFETIFGVLFVYILNQQLPSLMEFSGITLLLGSVIYGIRTLSPQIAVPAGKEG
jgi:drug/metabolite transporter (DMT)-like permease